MPIRYRCPQCHQLLSVATRMAGQPTTCPSCAAVHVVPPPAEAKQKAPKTPPTSPASAAERVTAQRAEKTAEPLELPPHPAVQTASAHILTEDPLGDRVREWGHDEDEEEGLVFRAVARKSDELDLIPMVDCVFLLLVFYMITASYALQKTIEMAPPAADKKGAVQAVSTPDELAQSSIIVQIDERNRISVDETPVADASALPDVLRAKMRGEQKSELVIEADPRSFHETVVAVVDAAHDLQFQRVRMATPAGSDVD